MADETTITDIDKRVTVCPLCEMLGYGQNYRCTERPNKGQIECRPVTQDAFADAHRKVITAPKGEWVEVTHSSGETILLKGLGWEEGNALRFLQPAGLKARENFVRNVSRGHQKVHQMIDGEVSEAEVSIKAPRKNWDKTYVPELSVTWQDPKSGDTRSYQIGGGKPLDDLKSEFPDIYKSGTTKAASTKSTDSGDALDEDAFIAEIDDEVDSDLADQRKEDVKAEKDTEGRSAMTEPIDEEAFEEDLEALSDIEGDGAYTDEDVPEESYAAAETAQVVDEDVFEKEAESDKGQLSTAAKPRTDHSHTLTINAPSQSQIVNKKVIRIMDENDEELTLYLVKSPATGKLRFLQEGLNDAEPSIEVKLKK